MIQCLPIDRPYSSIDYRGSYESTCDCMRQSILNAVAEMTIASKGRVFRLSDDNIVKLKSCNIVGACIGDDRLFLLARKRRSFNKSMKLIRVFDAQDDKRFVEFDSNILNWIQLIEKMQKEFFKDGIK